MPARAHGFRLRVGLSAIGLLTWFSCSLAAWAESAYVRVNQVGYETGNTPFRAYLMSTASESGASFQVINLQGATRYAGAIGRLLGTWSNSTELTYRVYALDFTVPGGEIYKISVSGPVAADSPAFAVDSPHLLYPGLLLNTLFFYETERDGPNYIPNALRDAPGHLKDANGRVYVTPPLDTNDLIHNVPPAAPLLHAQASDVDAAGGWWDAGDYMKYVETASYTVALMEIGIRDFPNPMGANAPLNPRLRRPQFPTLVTAGWERHPPRTSPQRPGLGSPG